MIPYIETHLTDHCNLRCAGCSHFSGLAQPYYKPLEDFINEMEQLDKVTNGEVGIIRLMGGEPLLHPQWLDFCLETRRIFPYSEIVFVTNGILIGQVTDEQIEEFNNADIELCISDYGLQLDFEVINKFKIRYFHGKTIMYNISLDLKGEQNKVLSFNNCDLVQGRWYFFKNGRLYQCCIMANIDHFCSYFYEKIDYELDDISIDIYTHTLKEIEEFLHTPHNVCRYCDTIRRHNSYKPFAVSRGVIGEWTK